ncbi:MAG: hypothetical protein ABJE95_38715 [Byssovorax sp.]
MAKAFSHWKVLPHDPIRVLAENLWTCEGSIPGMALKRVGSFARLEDGGLVLHNAMALDDASMARLTAWGTPKILLVPNAFHRLDARIVKDRFPGLRVLCPAGARKKVEDVVPVDGTYADFPSDPRVKIHYLDGLAEQEGVLEVKSDDGTTLIFNDVVFNQPHLPGFGGLIFRLMGSSGGPKVTFIARTFIVKDKKALRAHLERLAALPDLERIVVMHGGMMTDPADLRAAAAWL